MCDYDDIKVSKIRDIWKILTLYFFSLQTVFINVTEFIIINNG